MKKSLVLVSVLAALLLVTMMSVSVSAAPSLEIGTITVDKTTDPTLVTVTVPYTAVEVEQITILATKGGADAAPAETEENIVYVAQQESATASSFTFSVYYNEFDATNSHLWIKIGGTSIATAVSAGGEEIYAITSVLIYGDVNDDGKVSLADYTYIAQYVASVSTGTFDEAVFPDQMFPVGSIEPADVNDDGKVSLADATYIAQFVASVSTGTFDEAVFPGGKFPADK